MPDAMSPISILMGVLNGAPFLPEQLKSLDTQDHSNWTLTCSDDGSSDASGQIISDFANANRNQITQQFGPATGFSDNYMGLIRALPANPAYVAFADQDDIWGPGKLSRAIDALKDMGGEPALYCARRWVWYPQTGRSIASPKRILPSNFKNALIENIASGNTIVLNPAAARLARDAAQRTGHVFAHDWWLYLLITGAGGRILFDNDTPCVHYRQHSANAIGANYGMAHLARRKLSVLQGTFASRVALNIAAMHAVRDVLTPRARGTLDDFAIARRANVLKRLGSLYRIAPHRQTRLATLGFWGAAGVGRI
jgi:glycosyltransferase involved in cell wall biosynthesis